MKDHQEAINVLAAELRKMQGKPGLAPIPQAEYNGGAKTGGLGVPGSALTDAQVLEMVFAEEERGEEFRRVYAGDYEWRWPSASEAVASLLWKFAFYTGGDAGQMERLIRGSGLPSAKFDERRGGATWIAQEIEKAIAHTTEFFTPKKVSSSPNPLGGSSDDDTNSDSPGSPEIVWFHELGKPKPRKFVIEKVGRKAYPLLVYGAGGVAKSFAILAGGIAIASATDTLDAWMGLRVLEHGYVLYVDFELDSDEQHKRVVELCNGLGVPVPKRLAYISGRGFPRDATFARARKFCAEYKAVAVIIDSVGQAMSGDMDKNRDVNAFYRDYIEPFCAMDVTPMLVDHEGKRQAGEQHKDKSPIGGVFKTNNARGVLQFILDEYDKETSTLDIRVRTHKINFEPPEPFGISVRFEADKVSITTRELPDSELIDEERIPLRKRIVAALDAGPATNAELQRITGATEGSIRNALSALMHEEPPLLVTDGGRPKAYSLVSSSPPPPRGFDDDDTKSGMQSSTRKNKEMQAGGPALQGVRDPSEEGQSPLTYAENSDQEGTDQEVITISGADHPTGDPDGDQRVITEQVISGNVTDKPNADDVGEAISAVSMITGSGGESDTSSLASSSASTRAPTPDQVAYRAAMRKLGRHEEIPPVLGPAPSARRLPDEEAVRRYKQLSATMPHAEARDQALREHDAGVQEGRE